VPVTIAGPEPARESPQIAAAVSNQPAGVNVISQPNAANRTPVSSVLPPVNQVAPADLAGGGSAPATPRSPNAAGALPAIAESIPGVTRLVQPADGKFSAVVQGSPDTSRYPEAAGALGSRVVYTVYLRVGTRKNWILQYALPRGSNGTSGTPIDAPWPVVM